MSAKHTPGPWRTGMRPGPMIYGSDSAQVADLRGDLLDRGEAIANAHLIAAAPDLLAALQRLLSEHDCMAMVIQEDRWPEAAKQARAAIAKAKGE